MASAEKYSQLEPAERDKVTQFMDNRAEIGRLLYMRAMIDEQVRQLTDCNMALASEFSAGAHDEVAAQVAAESAVAGDIPLQRQPNDGRSVSLRVVG